MNTATGCRFIAGSMVLRGAMAAMIVGWAGVASAASLTWTGGVAGVWQNGAAGWMNGGSPANWNNATPDAAIFGGLATGAVSVSGGVAVGNLSVTQGVYAVGGAGTLTLSGTTIAIANGLTTTVSTALSGVGGFVKNGGGELAFTNDNKNYAGVTVISGGVVRITSVGPGSLGATATNGVALEGGALHALFSGNLNVSNFIAVGAAGGELRNLGNDSQRWQMIGNRITGSGPLTLSFGSNNSRFTMASSQNAFTGRWIIDSGGNQNRFADFSAGGGIGGAAGDNAVSLHNSGTVLLRNSVILGSATQGIVIGSGEAKFNAAGGAVVTIAGKISGPATNSVQFYGDNATSVLIISNVNNSWSGPTAINGSTAFATLRLGAAGVIPDTGGVVTINNAGRLDLNGFTEQIGALAGAGRVDNGAAASSASLIVGGNPSNTTFTGSMTNSGAGATLSLIKLGSGTLTLNSTNLFYAGATIISGGVIQVFSATNGSMGASMTGQVRLNGGALHGSFVSNTYVNYAIEVGPSGGELRNLGSDPGRWLMGPPVNGLTGSGTLTLSFGSSNTRFEMTNSQSLFTGKWVINSGGSNNRLVDIYDGLAFGTGAGDDFMLLTNAAAILLRPRVTLGTSSQGITLGTSQSYISTAGNSTCTIAGKILGPAGSTLTLHFENPGSLLTISNTANGWLGATTLANTGTLRLGASGVVPDVGGTWTLGSSVIIDLNGNREVMGGLTGGGAVDNQKGSSTSMLGIGANNASTTFSGTFSNSASGSTLGITKLGTGTLTLSGSAHAHSSTIVSSGVLLVTGSLPSGSQSEIAAGTLAGSTSVGHLKVRGGRVSPGHTSIGAMAVDTLTFTGGTYRFDISSANGTPGVDWDLLTVGGGSGAITNDTSVSNPVKIELTYGSSSLSGFNGGDPFSWKMVDGGSQTGFDTNKCTVLLGDFAPPQKQFGNFSVRSDSGDLYLDYTPYTNQVDLSVVFVSSTNYVYSGGAVSYTILVSNSSASVVGIYSVTSTLTANLQVTGSTPGAMTNGTAISWQLGGLASGATTTLVLNATPVYTGSTQEQNNVISVVVTPRYGDLNNTNNSANTSLTSVGVPMLSDIAYLLLVAVVLFALWRFQRNPLQSRP